MSLKHKIQLGFVLLALCTSSIGIYFLYSNSRTVKLFVRGSNEATVKLEKITLLEKNFGLAIQDWKNTLLRGSSPEGFKKHSEGFDSAIDSLFKTAAELKVLLLEDDKAAIVDFETKLKALEDKYKDTRNQYINSEKFEPALADKAVQGFDREVLSKTRELASKIGAESGEKVKLMLADMDTSFWWAIGSIALVSLTLLVVISIFLGRVLETVNKAIKGLGDVSQQVSSASGQIASSAEGLSQASTEQAASLEQTAASIEEMSSMVSKNSENARLTAQISKESMESATKGKLAVNDMINSMGEINESNNRIADIVKVIREIDSKTKVINDIVFQTKLLSFNASVEAARAGEHGKGFAVVAEEVGKLAQMSGSAAEEISTLLETSIQRVEGIVVETKKKVDAGSQTVQRCGEVLDDIVNSVNEVNKMAGDISAASDEQAQGVQEITKAMSQLDQVTQQNASSSEEAASAAEELSAQAVSLNDLVADLVSMVDGGKPTKINRSSADILSFEKKTEIHHPLKKAAGGYESINDEEK